MFRGFVGGRGAGKSWVGSHDMLRRAKRGRTYMIGSPTATVMGDTTFPTFKKMAQDFGVIQSIRLSPYPTIWLTTGAEIRFRTADNPEAMRGPNLSGIWLDEASQMAREAFEICIACLRQDGEMGWLSSTFTPKGQSHWTYEVFGQDRPDTEIFHSTTAQNPFLPAEFAATLTAQYGEGSHLEGQELGGKFLSAEGCEWPPSYFPDSIWSSCWPTTDRIICSALALDPAQGKGEKGKHQTHRTATRACYASFVLVAVDLDGLLHVDAWLSKDWDAGQLVETGLQICLTKRPGAFAFETNGGQEFLKDLILHRAKELAYVCPLWGICNYIEKEVRIRMLGPFLGQRRLRFREGSPGCKLLVNQLREFPVSEYRDGPDALEMAVRMCDKLLGNSTANGTPVVMRA